MKGSFGSAAFRHFDKVVAGVVVVIALSCVVAAVVRQPQETIDTRDIQRRIDRLREKQAASRHKPTPLTEDYLTRTIGGFHADAAGVKPARDPFREGKPPPPPRVRDGQPMTLTRRAKDANPKAAARTMSPGCRGAEIVVADKAVVKAEWSTDDPLVLLVTPLATAEATTTVALLKDRVELVKFKVTVKVAAEKKPEIPAVRGIVVRPTQGGARIGWLAEVRPINATVTRFEVLKSFEATAPKLYLTIPFSAIPADGAEIESVRPDRAAGPKAVFNAGRLELEDREVIGGTPIFYWVRAVGKAASGPVVLGELPQAPVQIQIPEAFTIVFKGEVHGKDRVFLHVTVFHQPETGPGFNVTRGFTVGVGQRVGTKVDRYRDLKHGQTLKNVDFSTGYQLLAILPDERVRGRKHTIERDGEAVEWWTEITRQKVLLISPRGRIRMLSTGD